MFDIGFFELVLIGIVSLVILGPERLPGAIRTVSLWVGRLRRSFNSIKQDIEREIGADEIRRTLRNEEIMEKFKHTQTQVKNTINSVQKETAEFKKNLDLEASVGKVMNANTPADKGSAAVTSSPLESPEPAATASTASAPSPQASSAPAESASPADPNPAKPQGDG